MTGSPGSIIHRVRHLLRHADPVPDAELLDRFVSDRDGEAFALLVRRHGALVHGVCRRVLRNGADADDAFQATFLVLARRARSIRHQGLLGNWLYGVAYRTALEARRTAAVRRARERKAAQMKATTHTEVSQPDLREVLDRELAALPDMSRAAIVLCDLEGLSRREAAARLGWSEGTLSGRLFRARAQLAARLARLGLAIPAAGLAGVTGAANAAVPSALAESTVKLGVLFAAGEALAIASAPVASLTEGVMKAMLLTKLKGMATALVVGCAVLATSAAGWQANTVVAADGQAAGQTERRASQRDSDKDRIAQLERERDELLKMVRVLKDRLDALEANQRGGGLGVDKRGAPEDILRQKQRAEAEMLKAERAALDKLAKLKDQKNLGVELARNEELAAKVKQMSAEKAGEIAQLERFLAKLAAEKAELAADDVKRAVPPELKEKLEALKKLQSELNLHDKRVGPAELKEKLDALKMLEAELAKTTRNKVVDPAREKIEKQKLLELEAYRAAMLMAQKVAGERATKLKPGEGDRVAALEDRVKKLERMIDQLLTERARNPKK